jgi:hypothetical protein
MAATAASAGADIDVPDMSCTALALQSTLVAEASGGARQCAVGAELVNMSRALVEAIMWPGATTSGFKRPSRVGPTLLNCERVSGERKGLPALRPAAAASSLQQTDSWSHAARQSTKRERAATRTRRRRAARRQQRDRVVAVAWFAHFQSACVLPVAREAYHADVGGADR